MGTTTLRMMTTTLIKAASLAAVVGLAAASPAHADVYALVDQPGLDTPYFTSQDAPTYATAALSWVTYPNYENVGSVTATPSHFGLYAAVAGQGPALGVGYTVDSDYGLGDTITTNGYSLVLPLHIDGSVNVTYEYPTDIPVSRTNPPAVWLTVGCNYLPTPNRLEACGGFEREIFSEPASVNQDFRIVVPTVPGVPVDFSTTVDVEANVDPEYIVGFAGAIGDFSHTGVFGPAEVLDANGNPIADPLIESSSGYDYLNPTGPVSGVPELPTWAMLALGFAGLGLVGRLSRRPRCAA